MARYIEREKFLKKCTEVFGHFGVLVKAIEEISDECTTADVAPRAEVAREIFDDIEDALDSKYNGDYEADYPIPYYMEELKDDIAELKKKYMEEQTNG